MYRLIACLIVVLGGWCAAVEHHDATPLAAPQAGSGLVTAWFQRAETYAAKMNEEAGRTGGNPKENGELSSARVILCEMYVRLGRIREAENFVRAFEGGTPEDRASLQICLAMALAYEGQSEAAIRWAESLDTGRVPEPGFPDQTSASPRERSLLMISVAQSREHDFAGAERTIRRIRDPEVIAAGWRRLAESQAKAGQYDEAAGSLARMVAVSKADEEVKEETRTLIAKCRAEGRRDSRPPAAKSWLDVFRNTTALFTGATFEGGSPAEQEAKAAGMTKPVNRAAAWRKIAWGYFRAGDRLACLRAIDQSLKSACEIPSEIGYQRAANELLLADLYLELGERSAAVELARKANDSGSRDLLVQRGLGAFTTRPLVISVFARTDQWEEAVAVARKSGDAISWQVLGVCLGQAAEFARAEEVLRTIQADSIKAVFCAGVTCGLDTMNHGAHPSGNKKPRSQN